MTKLKNKIKEAVSSVLPITCIVFLLSITITPMPVGTMLLFACGAVMLIIGMGLFSLGADMSMMLMGEGIGTMLSTSKKRCLMVCITFVIGFIITVSYTHLQLSLMQQHKLIRILQGQVGIMHTDQHTSSLKLQPQHLLQKLMLAPIIQIGTRLIHHHKGGIL